MLNQDYLFNLPDDPLSNSFKFEALIEVLKHESRFALREPYKSFVDAIVSKAYEDLNAVIPIGTMLYRGRLNPIDFHDNKKIPAPFPPEEMGPPPRHLAIPGRINPEGISYLYCAAELDTAGSELRPWKGAAITIAEVEIVKEVPIVDLTKDFRDSDLILFCDDFSRYFSIQWPPDLKLNYLPTQFISEHFKALGIRGIKYKSEFNIGGNNFALFDNDDYKINTTYNVEAIDVSYCFYNTRRGGRS